MKLHRRYRALKRELRRDLRELDIHPPLSVDELCSRLGGLRGRPIRMQAQELPAEVFGLWVPGAAVDYIVYQEHSTPVHQRHTKLHEFGHIYCSHQPGHRVEVVTSMLRDGAFGPDVAEDIWGGLARTSGPERQWPVGYDDDQEHEAEMVATIIMEWASVADYVTPSRADQIDVQQIQTALGERLGWL